MRAIYGEYGYRIRERDRERHIRRKQEREREKEILLCCFFLWIMRLVFFLPSTHTNQQTHEWFSDSTCVCVCVCVWCACVLKLCLESVSTAPPSFSNISISREFAAIFSVCIPCKQMNLFLPTNLSQSFFFFYFFFDAQNKVHDKVQYALN